MEQKPIERIRSLTRALILSGSLNILLIALFLYWYNREIPPSPYFELKPPKQDEWQAPLALDQKNSDLIRHFKTLSPEQLIAELSEGVLVEDGYTQRDLALAVLVTFHHFDLSRALSGQIQPTQHRAISYGVRKDGKPAKVIAYPGLSDKQYHAIIQFFRMEKWPLTPRGIFLALRTKMDDESLFDAFSLTSEFRIIEILFNRSEISVNKKLLMQVALEGSWQMLSTFADQQKKSQDLSQARRQAFLLNYIQHGSKAAADVMLQTDIAFAVKKLDDNQVKSILKLISPKEPVSQQFALALLTSPRSDEVWQLATQKLSEYSGEKKVDLAEYKPEVQKKVEHIDEENPKSIKQITIKPIPPQRERIHIVQEGDSLWKIAKKYKIDIELLKTRNQLKSDTLKPGIALKIPG